VQSLHQNKVQGKNVSPQAEFTREACEEKEKWIRGEGYGSQMCSCQNETSYVFNDLTFYFGTCSRWSWTRHQSKGDTICICFYVIQQRETNE